MAWQAPLQGDPQTQEGVCDCNRFNANKKGAHLAPPLITMAILVETAVCQEVKQKMLTHWYSAAHFVTVQN